MIAYEKPVLEIIELRPEERLAGNSAKAVAGISPNGWFYTILDHDQNGATDNNVDFFFGAGKKNGHGSILGQWNTSFESFLSSIGLNLGNWFK